MLISGETAWNAQFGLVLVHGRGAGAADIVVLAEILGVPSLAMAAPEAPGLSWWPTSFLAPTQQIEPFVAKGLGQIDAAIASFTDAGLPLSHIGVMGFSQGACLAAEYIARNGDGLGLGAILSGGLVGTADANGAADGALYGYTDKKLDYDTKLNGTQVYLSCHARDPYIPHMRFVDSGTVFERLGARISTRTKPGHGHGIDEDDLEAVRVLFAEVAASC